MGLSVDLPKNVSYEEPQIQLLRVELCIIQQIHNNNPQ